VQGPPAPPRTAEAAQEQGPSAQPRTVEAVAGGADVSMDFCVEDCLVGGVMLFDTHTGRGLAGKFFWVFDKIMMQGRMLGNWL
jgi:hypothetical protein